MISYDIGHQWKIEGCTAFVNNNLGESIDNFCKRSEDDEVKLCVVWNKSDELVHKNQHRKAISAKKRC